MDRVRTFTAEHRKNLGIAHRGSKNGPSRLKESQVLAIDRALRNGESIWDLGERYDVSHTTIWMIECGRTWGWLTKRPRIEGTGRSPGRGR
jgi:hypothetical protein